jgi:hypothetical protein
MPRRLRLAAVLVLLLGASGCGDNPSVIIHDCLVFWNEVCDYMLLANDDETAKTMLEVEFKCLKLKHDNLKERIDKRLKNNVDDDQKREYNGAFLDYYDEKVATGQRLYHARQRIDGVIAGIKEKDASASTDNLAKLRDWPKSYLFASEASSNPSFTGKEAGPRGYPRWGDGLIPMTFPRKGEWFPGAPPPVKENQPGGGGPPPPGKN